MIKMGMIFRRALIVALAATVSGAAGCGSSSSTGRPESTASTRSAGAATTTSTAATAATATSTSTSGPVSSQAPLIDAATALRYAIAHFKQLGYTNVFGIPQASQHSQNPCVAYNTAAKGIVLDASITMSLAWNCEMVATNGSGAAAAKLACVARLAILSTGPGTYRSVKRGSQGPCPNGA